VQRDGDCGCEVSLLQLLTTADLNFGGEQRVNGRTAIPFSE